LQQLEEEETAEQPNAEFAEDSQSSQS